MKWEQEIQVKLNTQELGDAFVIFISYFERERGFFPYWVTNASPSLKQTEFMVTLRYTTQVPEETEFPKFSFHGGEKSIDIPLSANEVERAILKYISIFKKKKASIPYRIKSISPAFPSGQIVLTLTFRLPGLKKEMYTHSFLSP